MSEKEEFKLKETTIQQLKITLTRNIDQKLTIELATGILNIMEGAINEALNTKGE